MLAEVHTRSCRQWYASFYTILSRLGLFGTLMCVLFIIRICMLEKFVIKDT